MKEGWIALHRRLLDCELWINDEDEPFDKRSAWIDLLLRCNHHDKQIIFDNAPMTVGRGQLVTSVRKLAERWGWGKNKVLAYLRLLETLNMIERVSDSRKTVLTIVKYDVYQLQEDSNGDTNKDSKRTVKGHQQATNNNINNDNNENNIIPPISPQGGKAKAVKIYFEDTELDKAFKEFEAMRKKVKKPLTEGAITRAMNKLHKLADYPGSNELDVDKAKAIINQSVDHCWLDFYELKGDKQKGNSENNEWLEMWRNA